MTDPIVPQPDEPTAAPRPASETPGYTAAPGYTPGYTPAPKTNVLAIVAIILGFIVPIGGIITGHIALSQIKKTGESGHGLALTGTIVGYVLSAAWIAFWIVYIVVILGAIAVGTSDGYLPKY
jgi:peptidyl-prolyl cis-trans isomerase B (cyclophilin B)